MTRDQIRKYIKDNWQKTDSDLGKHCGISAEAARSVRRRLGLTGKPENSHPEYKLPIADQIIKDQERLSETAEKSNLKKKNIELMKLLSVRDAEKAAILMLAEPKKPSPIKAVKGSGTSEATAVVIASDWHVEEEVLPQKVSYRNRFNLDISKMRAEQFFQNALRLIRKEQQDVEINTMVLGLLGDFISNNIHEELLENCLLRPIEAILYAQELIQAGIQFLVDNSKLKLVIVCHSGNHGRITKKIHISTEQGNSLEYFMYHSLKNHFRDNDRVEFVIAEGYHTYLEVYDKVVRLHHGHAMSYGGGIGGLTIPVSKAISQWNITRPADYDAFGHFHQYLPHTRFTSNGSLIGFSPYAVQIKAEFQAPAQSFYLIDKKRGKTIHAPILFNV